MYTPSPPRAPASNAYLYLTPHSSNPYAAHPSQSGSFVMPGGASQNAFNAYSSVPNGHFASSGLGWYSRMAPSQQPLPQHGSLSSIQGVTHPSGVQSPGFNAIQSPLGMPLARDSMSPATPRGSISILSDASITGAGPEWQRQLTCAEISRQSFAPHHHARAAALAARSSVDTSKGIQMPVSYTHLTLPTKRIV